MPQSTYYIKRFPAQLTIDGGIGPAMYYIFGDLHGMLSSLEALYGQLREMIRKDDTLLFLGDYIDRGGHSYGAVEFLIGLSRLHPTVFLKGNHEFMLLAYLSGLDTDGIYFRNGGERTIESYRRAFGSFSIPSRHMEFFQSLVLYHETDNFIAVHAGLNPKITTMGLQSEEDMLWIREDFYQSDKRWPKTIIFGHTPAVHFTGAMSRPYFDEKHNIIGLDTGAVYGGRLTCLRWPDRVIFQS